MATSLVNAEPRRLSQHLTIGPLAFGSWRLTSDVDTATDRTDVYRIVQASDGVPLP